MEVEPKLEGCRSGRENNKSASLVFEEFGCQQRARAQFYDYIDKDMYMHYTERGGGHFPRIPLCGG